MNIATRFAALIALSLTAGLAQAQTGTLDQSSAFLPAGNAIFDGNYPTSVWQQQVRAGLSGRLEGFRLQMNGSPGANIDVRVRMGPAWNQSPAVFQTLVATTGPGWPIVFVDATSANILLLPGSLFVIEIVGTNTGANVAGSWVAPPGTPFYPEPLFEGGTLYSDGGYRIGFETYILNAPLSGEYCFGDGSGTNCPCGNSGTAYNGCASSVNNSGAHLFAFGSASVANDSFLLSAWGMPNSFALFFQGTQRTAGGAGAVFGDGLRCASGSINRLGAKLNSSGMSEYPRGTDVPISVKGANTAGAVRDYQCWYRNAAAFCSPSTFNLTNGVEVTWTP